MEEETNSITLESIIENLAPLDKRTGDALNKVMSNKFSSRSKIFSLTYLYMRNLIKEGMEEGYVIEREEIKKFIKEDINVTNEYLIEKLSNVLDYLSENCDGFIKKKSDAPTLYNKLAYPLPSLKNLNKAYDNYTFTKNIGSDSSYAADSYNLKKDRVEHPDPIKKVTRSLSSYIIKTLETKPPMTYQELDEYLTRNLRQDTTELPDVIEKLLSINKLVFKDNLYNLKDKK